jgi:hypothetical protein
VVSPRSDTARRFERTRGISPSCRGSSSDRIQGLFGLDATSGVEDEPLTRSREPRTEGAGVHVLLEDDGDEAEVVNPPRALGVWNRGG